MEWVEITAKTVHDAKEAALDMLGVHQDDAEFEVVSAEKIGLFGRVKEEARVRARVRPTTPRAKDDRRRKRRGGKAKNGQSSDGGQTSGQKRQNGGESRNARPQKKAAKNGQDSRQGQGGQSVEKKRRQSKAQERKQEAVSDEPTMPLPEQADIAEAFVAGLAEQFSASVDFEREDIDENEIRITVTGSKLGRMIGQRGATAGAIDELVRTVLQRHAGSGREGRIRVDMGGVRARRAEALAAFSRKQAEAVRLSGIARSLEPMGGSDRKVVHDTISSEDGVETTSQGEDPNRCVVIVPAGDAD